MGVRLVTEPEASVPQGHEAKDTHGLWQQEKGSKWILLSVSKRSTALF